MSKIFRAVILSVLLIGLMAANSEANITVFPLTIVSNAVDGAGSGFFLVRNNGDTTDEVTVNLADWLLDESGNIKFLESGSTDRSLAPLVQYSPVSFTLEPEEVQRVDFTYAMPASDLGDHWFLFLVDSNEVTPIAETTGEVNTNIGVRVGFGVKVYVTDPNAMADGRVTGMRLDASNPLSIIVRFANSGTAVLRDVVGAVEVRDVFGATVRTLNMAPFTVLPDGVREVKVSGAEDDKPLPKGDYVALAIIDFGGDVLVAGELPFTID